MRSLFPHRPFGYWHPQQNTQLVMSSLMNTSHYFLLGEEPTIRPGSIELVFPPEADFRCKMVYKAGEKVLGETLFTNIQRAGKLAWIGARRLEAVRLGSFDGVRTQEVYVNESLVGSLTIQLKKVSGGDALDPKVSWSMVGPWKDRAYLTHSMTRANATIYLVYWISLDELGAGEPAVVASLKRGSTVIATGDKRLPNGPGYSRFDHPFMKPNRSPFDLADLASLSGPLTIEVKQANKVLRSWQVQVTKGALVPHPASDIATLKPGVPYLAPRFVNSGNRTVSDTLLTWLAP